MSIELKCPINNALYPSPRGYKPIIKMQFFSDTKNFSRVENLIIDIYKIRQLAYSYLHNNYIMKIHI